MLRLALIGAKGAEKLKTLVDSRFDYVETTVFRTIQDFCETSDIRSMTVDRLFILQDAFDGEPDMELLVSFNNYLGKYYPAIRVVSLLNKPETLELFSTVFISPAMVHIIAAGMKSKTIDDIVEQKTDYLQEKYGYVSKHNTDDSLNEIIDDGEDTPEEQEQQAEQENGKKSKGFFSIFGRGKKGKKDKKGKKEEKRNEGLAQIGDIPVYQPDFDSSDESDVPNFGLPQYGESEDNESQYPTQESDDLSDMDAWSRGTEEQSVQEPEPQEPDVEFTMFDGEVSVGNTDEPVVESEDLLDDLDEVEDYDFPDVEDEDTLDFETFEEEREKFDEEPAEEPPVYETGLDLDNSGDVEADLIDTPPVVVPDIKQQQEKFNTVKRDAMSKEVDTSIADMNIPSLPKGGFAVQDVSGDFPVFSDLGDLEQQYNDKNIRVVEVEKIVEKVIEKPVHVGGSNSGASKKVYPTGVRTIVFTGDRKSGVTLNALRSAMFFGKTERTLFVDYDVKRKGSLLHYGVNNIVLEHDNVHNGLIGLKSTNMLKHVVYNYVKGGFDCLISLYGEPYEKEDLVRTQRILSTQRDYSTVIIDCPLENLHLLEDILLYSEIVICMESDLHSTVNTVMGLAGAYEEDSKLAIFLYNNAKYLLTKNPDPKKFRENLDYVSEIFSLDEEETDWSLTPILGTSKDLTKILNRM